MVITHQPRKSVNLDICKDGLLWWIEQIPHLTIFVYLFESFHLNKKVDMIYLRMYFCPWKAHLPVCTRHYIAVFPQSFKRSWYILYMSCMSLLLTWHIILHQHSRFHRCHCYIYFEKTCTKEKADGTVVSAVLAPREIHIPTQGLFCVEFRCSPCACEASHWILLLPPTVMHLGISKLVTSNRMWMRVWLITTIC